MDDQNFTPEPSTVIDQDLDTVNSGGGKPAVEPTPAPEKPSKPESARDSLEAEAKKITTEKDDGDDQDDDKQTVAKDKPAKVAEKTEVKESEAKAKDESERAEKTKRELRSESLREPPPAPARLLPTAQEKWKHVPQEVKFEVTRVLNEAEAEKSKFQESHQFREELRSFEDEAKAGGTTIKEALTNYVTMEKALRSDPAQGFRQLLSNMQMQPQQAISHILNAFNVTPQALAQHISQNPNDYTALAAPRQQQFQPQQPQHQQVAPEVKALQDQLNAMRAEQVASSVIAPFRQEYPEYDQYEDQIAKVLSSGIIDQIHGSGIGPREKLEVALFMVSPSSKSRAFASNNNDGLTQEVSGHNDAPVDNLRGGNKSVRSSVGSITYPAEPDRKLSLRETLEEEAKKLSRRA